MIFKLKKKKWEKRKNKFFFLLPFSHVERGTFATLENGNYYFI
jgi:hypothetical protein